MIQIHIKNKSPFQKIQPNLTYHPYESYTKNQEKCEIVLAIFHYWRDQHTKTSSVQLSGQRQFLKKIISKQDFLISFIPNEINLTIRNEQWDIVRDCIKSLLSEPLTKKKNYKFHKKGTKHVSNLTELTYWKILASFN